MFQILSIFLYVAIQVKLSIIGNNMEMNLQTYYQFEYLRSEESYKKLKSFPSDESILQFDNVVVVKISD